MKCHLCGAHGARLRLGDFPEALATRRGHVDCHQKHTQYRELNKNELSEAKRLARTALKNGDDNDGESFYG